MRHPDKITAQVFRPGEQGAIVFLRKRLSAADRRFFMHRNAAKKYGLAVQQDLRPAGLNGAKANFVRDAVAPVRNHNVIELGMVRRPPFYVDGESEYCAP